MKRRNFKNVSIKDIAVEAGVAISTVSNVINNTRSVRDTTKAKVNDAIQKLDYRPNIIARGLRTKSTNAIGVIVPDIGSPYFSQVIKGMEEVARSRKYTLILGCTSFDFEEEKRITNILLDQFIDGLIFFSGYDNYGFLKKYFDKNIPMVVLDKEVGDKDMPTVNVDNFKAFEECVDYLYNFGHRKIGIVSFTYDKQTTVRLRFEGYLSGLRKNNLEFDPEIVIMEQSVRMNETIGTYENVKKFLSKGKIPTAFITVADVFAYGLMRALKEEGFMIPQDISILGFDNIVFSEFTDPLLTTMKQPKKLLGNTAMNLLLDTIEGKQVKQKRIVLPTTMIERNSVTYARQHILDK